jgi:hypothetical protein
VVVRVARGAHGADGLVVAGVHDAVHDLVVATVPAHRDDEGTAAGGGLPGQVAGMTGMLGRGELERHGRQALFEFVPELLGRFRCVAGAVGVEDDDDPIERTHAGSLPREGPGQSPDPDWATIRRSA